MQNKKDSRISLDKVTKFCEIFTFLLSYIQTKVAFKIYEFYEYALWAKKSSPIAYWLLNKVCFGMRFFGPNLFGVRLFGQKSSFSEKATKFSKKLPLVFTLLSKNSCFVRIGGRCFQILWPYWSSHNILTLCTW